MMTLFDLLRVTGACVGVWYAASWAYREWGWPAAVVAGALGYAIGTILGRLPYVAVRALMLRGFELSSDDRLRGRLEGEYYISHLLIAELVSRGEPAEQFRGYVAGLLQSEDPDRRRFGTRAASVWFPDLVAGSPETRKAAERNEWR